MLTILSSSAFFFASCATKKPLQPFRPQKEPVSWSQCRAKAYLKGESEQGTFSSPVQLRFRNVNQPELLIIFSNVFGQSVGRLEIEGNQVSFLSSHDESTETPSSALEKWAEGPWWHELSFVFGAPSPIRGVDYFQDDRGRPVKMVSRSREVFCFYRKSIYPQYCTIDNAQFSARLNFSFVDCEEQLS